METPEQAREPVAQSRTAAGRQARDVWLRVRNLWRGRRAESGRRSRTRTCGPVPAQASRTAMAAGSSGLPNRT
ncbi:hypothetical protein ACFU67_07710 [Streptomyces rhizosphaericola]|uniref:hypothetical protein n=1 Tax=Streptomyces rhizosphaericola TaxID=2564098 RepID=UPI0036C3F12E